MSNGRTIGIVDRELFEGDDPVLFVAHPDAGLLQQPAYTVVRRCRTTAFGAA